MILVTIVHGGYKPTYNKKTLSEVLCEDSGVDLFGFQCSWFPVSISAVFRSGGLLSMTISSPVDYSQIWSFSSLDLERVPYMPFINIWGSTPYLPLKKKDAQHCLILPKNAKYIKIPRLQRTPGESDEMKSRKAKGISICWSLVLEISGDEERFKRSDPQLLSSQLAGNGWEQ